MNLSAILSEYCKNRSLTLTQYEQDQEYFLSVSGTGAAAGYLQRLIYAQYPSAQCITIEEHLVVYKLGTIFDLIQNPSDSNRPINISMLRSLMPDLIANEIVGVQPMMFPENLLGSLRHRSESSTDSQDKSNDQ